MQEQAKCQKLVYFKMLNCVALYILESKLISNHDLILD